MFKKLMKSIRKQLMKIDWVRHRVELYRMITKKEQHKLCLDLIVSSGQVRNLKPEKLEPFDTFGVVTLEEYHGGKVVGRESMILNSENWGNIDI
ncbi:MAG TPA: hypothetical protein VFC58_13765 [Desulfosporosinus sp.]|nr:hypothetical protein [Desulfosporosinus sp.]